MVLFICQYFLIKKNEKKMLFLKILSLRIIVVNINLEINFFFRYD